MPVSKQADPNRPECWNCGEGFRRNGTELGRQRYRKLCKCPALPPLVLNADRELMLNNLAYIALFGMADGVRVQAAQAWLAHSAEEHKSFDLDELRMRVNGSVPDVDIPSGNIGSPEDTND